MTPSGAPDAAREQRRALLRAAYAAAVEAVAPGPALTRALADVPCDTPAVVLGAGKAACAMAAAAADALGPRLLGGALTTKDGHACDVPGLAVAEAAHPVPDARSRIAACDALAQARGVGPTRELWVLISGGASALWCAPTPPLGLADKRAVTAALLRCGADIAELNQVRSALSDIKGGGLLRAAASARRVRSFALSDVRDDVPAWIGSGPSAPVQPDRAAARAIVARYGLEAELPAAVLTHLETAAAPALRREPQHTFRVIAGLGRALDAVRDAWRGADVVDLGAALYDDVEACARRLAAAAAELPAGGRLLAGGEPTVVVRGPGLGGRAQELALRWALELEARGLRDWSLLCAGTDGSDGPTEAAGALADCASLERMRAGGCEPRERLARSDSHAAWAASGDLFTPGPTGTNANDLALLVRGPADPIG